MNDKTGTRLRSCPGEITAAALLAWGAMSERVTVRRGLLAAIPVTGVNIVAFYGQLSYLRDHLAAPAAVQVLTAAVLESIAVYLAWMSHLALVSGDSAFRLRLASYLFALVIAAMNYSHFAGPGWRPTFTAVAFALCSAISPWLWAVYSRRASRDELHKTGYLDKHAVRLGATRWAWHPLLSARVMSRAAWLGVTKPAEATALVEPPSWAVRSGDSPEASPPDSPAGEAPPPVPLRREPRRAVSELREARKGAQGLAAASRREDEILRGLLEGLGRGNPLPSIRRLSRDEFGVVRSKTAERVLRQARASQNGHGPR